MCIWKWCMEGWVVVSIIALLALTVLTRGCSEWTAADNQLIAKTELSKIEAGLEQCPKTDSQGSGIIWVKNCKEYMITRKFED